MILRFQDIRRCTAMVHDHRRSPKLNDRWANGGARRDASVEDERSLMFHVPFCLVFNTTVEHQSVIV